MLLPEVLLFDTYPGGLHQLCSPSEHSDGLTGAQNITRARVFVASSATGSGHPLGTMEDPMPIGRHAAIPLREITLRASRSSGPGGQHANVTASRIEAIFDVAASAALTDEQKRRVIARLGPRVVAVAQDERFQQLADNINEVFFVQDSQFRETIYISPAYERVWGRSCQSLLILPVRQVASVKLML